MVGLQVADLLCSAILFPMTTFAYCSGHVQSRHVNNKYQVLRARYGERLRRLQFRYKQSENQKWMGGVSVNDGLAKRSGKLLFVEAEPITLAITAQTLSP
jgi:hypothetical protein